MFEEITMFSPQKTVNEVTLYFFSSKEFFA